jgi:hypothetical protein
MSVVVKSKDVPKKALGERWQRWALACAGALFVLLHAGTPRAAENVTISVLTMGPGDPTFSKFGHDAIVVSQKGQKPRVYNFGTFAFQSNTLFRDFLSGRLRYWLSVGSLQGTLSSYRRQNRSLLLQRLDLEPAAAEALALALEENALPENKYYLYDHFRDNCSTRVRDAIDRTTGGAVRRALDRPAALTYRDHALRLVADDWLLFLGLDLGLGPRVDGRITEWDEGFLPERLARSLKSVRMQSANGELPLVVEETRVFEANRAPLLEVPPMRAPWLAALGLAMGGAFAFLVRRPSRAARIAAGTLMTTLGLVSGLLGALLLFFWFFTNNEVAHKNANAFLSPVVALALVPAGIAFAMGRSSGERLTRRTLFACLALSAIGIVFALVVGQDVARTGSLFVPLWLAAALGLYFAKAQKSD